MHRLFPGAVLLLVAAAAGAEPRTVVTIEGAAFRINGRPTYEGRVFRGYPVEGLLLNARLVQGIFDDRNPETRPRWAYPDTGRFDPDRNTREFLAAMPEWRRHGLLSLTINLQGGSPEGYSKDQPWYNSAFEANGALRPDYLRRLQQILDFADELGMAPIVGYFYFGQDERLRDEAAVLRATDEATSWLLAQGYRNVLVEIDNECDLLQYDHAVLRAPRVHELIERVKKTRVEGRRLLVGTSFSGGAIPTPNVVAASDFLLLHGNGVNEPRRIAEMVRETRALPGYRPMPILFNEDDHFDFEKPSHDMLEALASYASWGYFEGGKSDYSTGYQCPPVNWTINTARKQAFFERVREIAGLPER
jgi:hypothetical protein